MTFAEVLPHLLAGKACRGGKAQCHVRRVRIATLEGTAISSMFAQFDDAFGTSLTHFYVGQWLPGDYDLLRDDWSVLDDKPPSL